MISYETYLPTYMPTCLPEYLTERHMTFLHTLFIFFQNRETQADAPPPQIIQLPPQQPVIEEHAFKQTTTKRRIEQDEMSEREIEDVAMIENGDTYHKPVRFAVRSLGWTDISEDELTAEKSSRAVNR